MFKLALEHNVVQASQLGFKVFLNLPERTRFFLYQI